MTKNGMEPAIMETMIALDFLPARQAMKTAGAIRLEASALRSEAKYLAVLCGPDDSEWLQTAERMGEVALCLEPPPTASPEHQRDLARMPASQRRYQNHRGRGPRAPK